MGPASLFCIFVLPILTIFTSSFSFSSSLPLGHALSGTSSLLPLRDTTFSSIKRLQPLNILNFPLLRPPKCVCVCVYVCL
uniref:Putative secreted peptide n=1 Tax=Anopheles braziliensis TaxID=58242 RepID=A0A2M3ZUC7_9DIPT